MKKKHTVWIFKKIKKKLKKNVFTYKKNIDFQKKRIYEKKQKKNTDLKTTPNGPQNY